MKNASIFSDLMKIYNCSVLGSVALTIATTIICSPVEAKATESDVAYKNALSVWKNGNQHKAETLLSGYVQQFPSNQKIALFDAVCVRSRFNVDDAAPLFIQIVSREKAGQKGAVKYSLQAQCALAMLAIDSRRSPETGFKVLNDVVRQNPSDPIPIWLLAISCRTLDKNKDGVAAYRNLLKVASPGSSLVHQTFANMLDKVGKHEEALKSRYIAVKLEPAPWSYDGVANTLARMGKNDEALKYHRKTVALAPNGATGWYNLGTLLLHMKRYGEAEESLRNAVNLAPTRASFLFNFGLSLKNQDKWSEAEEVFAVYCQSQPEDIDGWEYWGDCLYQRKDYAVALEKYKMIEKLGNKDPDLYYALYMTLHELGREEEALKYKSVWEKTKKH